MQYNSHRWARRGGLGNGRATRREFLTILPGIIVLPGIGSSARLGTGARLRCAPTRRSERLVFVVDDFKELTALYRACLELAGFEVRTFNDRAQALRAFLAANPRPALLITDYDGYPISAEQLMAECRQTQPDLKILMASGYPECCLNFSGVRPDRFLPKPFGLDQLVAEVRALTRSASAPATDFLQGS
jgi:CheY-like chemotaxis protein